SSLLYAAPLQIAQSTTLKAIALGTNLIPSSLDSARYNIAINGNFAPSANAGPDQSVFTTSVVQLDGSGTSDLDDPIGSLTIAWTQLGGPSVSLSDANSPTPDFVANLAGDYEFELSVADEVATDKDTVLIKVSDFDPDLMAYWPMDETNGSTASELVNGLNAQLGIGTSWSPTDGQIQGSLSFDGTSGRAEAPAIDPSGDEMTINFWMKASSLANVEARMISKASGTSGDDHYWMLSQNGGSALRFRLKTDNGGTATLISATGQIAAGNWYMVSAVYDGTEMRLYKDGVEIASLAKSGNISANNSILTGIGNQPSGAGDRPFAGQLDEVRIYDRALSQGEIVALYNEASTVFGVEWGYFVVDAEPSINLLRWQSLSETNTSYYAIERRAESDSVFAELGRVPAAGFSQQPLVYGWQDESPLRGTSFYRLRQVDQDLSTSYSVEISVRRSRSPELLVYPNPFGNQLTVRSNYSEAGSLELIDQTGRSVWRSQLKQQTQIQLSHLSTGIYQLVLRDQQGQYLTSTTCLRW
ncbi:MAG: LamG-like jellyroll fold domain-containing protein, partial [Bacteroidota bacterium]